MAAGTGLLKSIDFEPALDFGNVYAQNDVLFITTEITDVGRVKGANVSLNSIHMVDVDDEADTQIQLIFFRTNVVIDAFNVAFGALTDAESQEIATVVDFDGTDVTVIVPIDLTDNKYYALEGLAQQIALDPDSTSLWVAGILRSATTPTYAGATDLKFKLGFTQD